MSKEFRNGINPSTSTVDASGLAEGDIWYRSDSDTVKFRGTSNSCDLVSSMHLYGAAADDWKKASQHGSVDAAAPTAGEMYLMPLWPSKAVTIKQIAFEITTQGISVSGTDLLRFGIYNSSTGGVPSGAALIDWGTSDLEAVAGVKVVNVTDQALDPVLYWLAVVRQTTGSIGTAAQVRRQLPHMDNSYFMRQTGATPAIGTDGATGGYYLQTSVTGALPSIGTIAISGNFAPCLWLQTV